MIKKTIILASKSQRRKDLLKQAKIHFTVHVSAFQEMETRQMSRKKYTSKEYVLQNACGKARNIALHYKDAIIIGADTIGSYKSHILEKPKNFKEAKAMLKMLNGKVHEVYTGLCLIDTASGKELKEVDTTKVFFDKLTDSQIEDYLKKEEYLDKAGAFAIQGLAAFFIQRIEGSYSSVMGLPLHLVRKMLEQLGVEVF